MIATEITIEAARVAVLELRKQLSRENVDFMTAQARELDLFAELIGAAINSIATLAEVEKHAAENPGGVVLDTDYGYFYITR